MDKTLKAWSLILSLIFQFSVGLVVPRVTYTLELICPDSLEIADNPAVGLREPTLDALYV